MHSMTRLYTRGRGYPSSRRGDKHVRVHQEASSPSPTNALRLGLADARPFRPRLIHGRRYDPLHGRRHRTPLGASLFGPRESRTPQPLQEGDVRGDVVDPNRLSVQLESHGHDGGSYAV